MAIIYFDSSALVKLVVDEDGSDVAAMLWDGSDAAVSSRLAYPEVHGALAAAARNHQMSKAGYGSAQRAWNTFWAAMRPVELTVSIEQEAGRLAGAHALRGADAIHLASALAVGSTEVLLAVWDKRLRAGAERVGLPIAPA